MAYFILTCFSMWTRPDFVNVTVAAVGAYIVQNPEVINWSTWRKYTALVAMTWVYDLVYLFFIHDASSTNAANGGNGAGVLYLSLFFAYISFFFRIVVVAILWYDSHDFVKIIKGDKSDHQTQHVFGERQAPQEDDEETIFRRAMQQNF